MDKNTCISKFENNDQSSSQQSARRAFLRRSAIGVAVTAPTVLLTACGTSAHATGVNVHVGVNTDQSSLELYGSDYDDTRREFAEIKADEDAHVTFLKNALGNAGYAPRPMPTFTGLSQKNLAAFVKLSRTFENVGVGAYLMAAPAISNPAYLAAAGSILTIEARHAGFLDVLTHNPISSNGAFDKPLTQAAIVQAVKPFIKSLNGGSDPSAPLKNDVDILNFALLLEYLEANFYDINVPRLFR